MSSNPWGIGCAAPKFIDLRTFIPLIDWTGKSQFNGHHNNISAAASEQNRISPPVDPLKSYVRRGGA